jgi:hypothetical protein
MNDQRKPIAGLQVGGAQSTGICAGLGSNMDRSASRPFSAISRGCLRAVRNLENESICNSCLSPRAPFVSHFYAWEAKTKARRKLRRLRSPNPNQSPAAGAKGSPQPRPSKRGNGWRAPSVVSQDAKRPSMSLEGFSAFRVDRVPVPQLSLQVQNR